MPCGDTFAFWTGVYGGRTVADAYLLVDRFDNTTFGPTVPAASQPHPDLAVSFADQLSGGPNYAGFTLGVDWASGATRPTGTFTSTLTVDYPTGPDWPAGQVSHDATIVLDGEPSRALINKLSYDARFGVDDGPLPQVVPPGAEGEALAALPDGSRPRLVLLAISGTSVHGSSVVAGSDEPSLESTKVYRNFGSAWGKATAQAPYDAVLDLSSGGEVELWVEAAGENRPVTDVAFRVNVCPRFEHLTQDSPPGECSAAPVDSDPVTGTATVALNPPDGQRGYLGVELARAPVAPGVYSLGVRSVGSTPYRIRPAAHLHQRSSPEHELEGGFVFFTVLGGEILDENFQRVEILDVNQPKIAYVRLVDPGEVEDTVTLIVETFDEDGELVDRIDALELTRVGRSAVFLSAAIELHPGFTEPGGAQAMSSSTQRSRTAPKGAAKVRNPSRDVAKAATRWGDTYVVPFGLTLPLEVYRSQAFNDLVTRHRYYLCSPPAGDCPVFEDVLLDPAEVEMSIVSPAGADAEGERQLARFELEQGGDPLPGWYLRGIRMTMDGAGAPMRWSDGSVRAPEGRLTVKASSPLLGSPVTARVALTRPARLGDRTDGYPVCHTPGVLLEPIVIAMADKYGIPPHYLMSQVHKESMSGPGGCRNEYSYRYEPYAFDFKYLSGDQRECCRGNDHKLMLAADPFLTQGVLGASGRVEMLPRAVIGDPVPARVTGVVPLPVGSYPTTLFDIPDIPGPVYWDVRVYEADGSSEFAHARPGRSAGANEFRVDCRTGRIRLGAARSDGSTLRVDYTPLTPLRAVAPVGFGAGLGSPFALSTAQINQLGPNTVTPPNESTNTISAWSAPRVCPDQVLTQSILRYGLTPTLSPYESCMLIAEDPSFDVQGQWFAGASYGLMQVWPANAESTIYSAGTAAQKTFLRSLYDPLTEPGAKLSVPAIGVEFGAAADAYVTVRAEVKSDHARVWAYEGPCASDDTASPRTRCTWQRWWARRFAAFNRGSDDELCGEDPTMCRPNEFVNYGRAIVDLSGAYVPDPVPVP